MPQKQFQRVKQKQNPSAEKSGDRDSPVTACPGNSATQKKKQQGTLSQAVVRIVNEAADQEGNGDVGGSKRPQK